MTIGLSALLRISSKELYSPTSVREAGTKPVAARMPIRDTLRKPKMSDRGVGVRVDGDEMAAEPVPVRRPGFTESGVEAREVTERSTGSVTGRRNIGLKLDKLLVTQAHDPDGEHVPECQPEQFYP